MTNTTEEFKQRFIAVLTDLKAEGYKDPEAMWLLGSLAADLIDKGKKGTWAELKRALTQDAYDNLLKSFETQANALMKAGKGKAAYVLQALSVSLIAERITDAELAAGDELLDELIEGAIATFRRKAKAARKSN